MNRNDSQQNRAAQFWQKYDIPIKCDTAIIVRRSGLSRGSWGDGRAADTVVHLHVKESFKDGRLSRGIDSFLCKKNSHVADDGREERHTGDDGQYTPAVTCETCLSRMERWKLPPEERLKNNLERFGSDEEDDA